MDRIEDILKREKKVAKSTVTYLDDNGNVVDKAKAKITIITEFDEDENVINEIYGHTGMEQAEEER